VRKEGLEPSRFYPPDPKSGASANSATLALCSSSLKSGRFTKRNVPGLSSIFAGMAIRPQNCRSLFWNQSIVGASADGPAQDVRSASLSEWFAVPLIVTQYGYRHQRYQPTRERVAITVSVCISRPSLLNVMGIAVRWIALVSRPKFRSFI
jgi:hypothetical protein